MNAMRLGDTIIKDFTITNPTTGAVSDADSLPTCEIFEDANDTAILTPTVTKRVGKTGNYRISISITTANGFEIGKSYNVIVSATVGGISAKDCIDSFIIDIPRRPTGSVVTGTSATSFVSNRAESVNDYWKDALCLFITGNLEGQVKKITGYTASTFSFTFESGFTSAPSTGDIFEIINV